MVLGMSSEPLFDLRSLVGRIVVHHQMDFCALRMSLFYDLVDLVQETQELLVPMPFLALANDFPGFDVKGSKQGRRTVSDVVMGSCLRRSRAQRRLMARQWVNGAFEGCMARNGWEPVPGAQLSDPFEIRVP